MAEMMIVLLYFWLLLAWLSICIIFDNKKNPAWLSHTSKSLLLYSNNLLHCQRQIYLKPKKRQIFNVVLSQAVYPKIIHSQFLSFFFLNLVSFWMPAVSSWHSLIYPAVANLHLTLLEMRSLCCIKQTVNQNSFGMIHRWNEIPILATCYSYSVPLFWLGFNIFCWPWWKYLAFEWSWA